MKTHTNKLYPLIVTADLAATRAFYADTLGCRVVISVPEYLQVAFGEGENAPELAFSTKGLGATFGFSVEVQSGSGLLISIPSDDVDVACAALREKKVRIDSEPANRPWGWRSFVVTDPNGVRLDFFRQLPQAAALDATG
jgi:catechol 2,3-dioxygenase-like lactoylglutathione lyase family enzyme